MTKEELSNKILSETKSLTDDEWLRLREEALKLDNRREFFDTLAGHVLAQMSSFAELNKQA